MPEPSLADIFNLIKTCASKQDVDDIKTSILTISTETAEKIESMSKRIDQVEAR